MNWARRTDCNVCNEPKFGTIEPRTGLGGGYNERDGVEYLQREASDDEYDDVSGTIAAICYWLFKDALFNAFMLKCA